MAQLTVPIKVDLPEDWLDQIMERIKQDGDWQLITRCRDCKHHEDEEPGMVYCPNQVGGWVSEDFFCADGKRREEDE